MWLDSNQKISADAEKNDEAKKANAELILVVKTHPRPIQTAGVPQFAESRCTNGNSHLRECEALRGT